jgi:hypothetical protein
MCQRAQSRVVPLKKPRKGLVQGKKINYRTLCQRVQSLVVPLKKPVRVVPLKKTRKGLCPREKNKYPECFNLKMDA